MASTWSSGYAIPTTGYVQEFIDFLPECRKSGGFLSQPEYETFRTLVDRANEWLLTNPNFQLKRCESIQFTATRYQVNPEKMVYYEPSDFYIRHIRGLRLWIEEKKEKEKSQQFGYLNLIPQKLERGGVFSSPIYETLDDVIRRFNLMIRTNPLPGRIITVESQEIKTSYLKEVIDPDESSWTEKSDMQKLFLFVLRIFYELSDETPEEIGIMDFVPALLSNAALFTLPRYEFFSDVVEKASNWWQMQHGMKICNVQSLDIKAKRGQETDSQIMSYTESGNMNTYYLRILRIVYIKSEDKLPSKSNVTKITCKTIAPFQTRSSCVPEFQTLQETKNRVSAWIKATGIQVISAETTAVRMQTREERGNETTFSYNTPDRSTFWMFVFRLYINGDYQEPPAEMLPPVPEIEYRNCCTLL